MRRIWRENSLSIVLFFLFATVLMGQIGVGRAEYNHERSERGQPPLSLAPYLTSGHFIEATFENWESEFLQIAAYVLLTIFLRQKGSPDSKKLEGDDPFDEPSKNPRGLGAAPKWLYENSLTLALLTLFLISFGLHGAGGMHLYNEEQAAKGEETVSLLGFLGTSRFWFQSFQNWQSEFLSVGVLVIFTIFLRQKGSPESKPVDAANEETGG
ncbi:MAG: hypothetical protein H7Z41_14310 [Cytophagales bacterium]|nr:hypothetical protein [Armatimonadota bacterium]